MCFDNPSAFSVAFSFLSYKTENGCISNRGIKMLQCFKDLQKVDITGTSVKVNSCTEFFFPELIK